MSDSVYKKVDLVGTSKDSIEDAVRGAVRKASESIHHMDWFEVKEVRGWIKDGEVQHFQVAMQVGFKIDGT